MDIRTACEIIEIDIHDFSSFTPELLRKKYHKKALQYHPDKCGNDASSTERFQRIQNAYDYLLKSLEHDSTSSFLFETKEETNDKMNQNMDYLYFLTSFIQNIIYNGKNGSNRDIFISIVKDISSGCKQISVKLFDSVDKELALEIYGFLVKYKTIINIGDNILSEVHAILLKKYQNTHLVVINPSLTDMFDSNVYKLMHNNLPYYIPLWHNELYYDCLGETPDELVVRCVPDLPSGIVIDEQNNIHITLLANVASINMKTCTIPFSIGNKMFELPCPSLYIKPEQYYTIKRAGIPRIDDMNMYNDGIKSDVIVKLLLS